MYKNYKELIQLSAGLCATAILLTSCQSSRVVRLHGEGPDIPVDTAYLTIEYARPLYGYMGLVYYSWDCRVKVRANDIPWYEATLYPGEKLDLTVPAGRIEIDYFVTSNAANTHSLSATLAKDNKVLVKLESKNESACGLFLVFYARPIGNHEIEHKFTIYDK
jgi:hypothetical protein